MILLVGDTDDLSAAYLGWLAEERGAAVIALREDRVGLDWSATVDGDGALRIEVRGRPLDPASVTGAVVRLHPQPGVDAALGIEAALQPLYVSERRAGLHHVLDAMPWPVVNRPSRGRDNGSKPLQMAALARSGFDVPAWCASNDAGRIARFVADQPTGAVLKAASGLRSHVRRWDGARAAAFAAGTCPSVVQAHVAGVDVRAHVVADVVFGTQVVADTVDYRFDTDHAAFSAIDVPADVARRCVAHAAGEGVVLAGFDFRVDDAGRWWCLEMNPVPTFLPYEAGTGARIGDRIVDLVCDLPSPFTTSPLHDRVTA